MITDDDSATLPAFPPGSAAPREAGPLGAEVPRRPATRRPRRRRGLWMAAAAAIVVAVLIAVLASSPPASEVLSQSPLNGRPAPAITGPAILNGPVGGGPVQLSSSRGRWVLVNFAASWCVPCREEMPQLLLFARQHRATRDATILTVAYDQGDIGDLRRFLSERHVTWPVVDQAQAKVDYGVGKLPESYFVDPEGTVVALVEGQARAADLDRLITRYSAPASNGS